MITETRIALLSNVNMNFVIRGLKGQVEVYEAEGYGNELGIMMNPASSYHDFHPQITFLIMDLMELLGHELEMENVKSRIEEWFATFESTIQPETVYYLSDAKLWGPELDLFSDDSQATKCEQYWQKKLEALCVQYDNLRIFPYRKMIDSVGVENAFSLKTWYMGKILLASLAQKKLVEEILEKVALEYRTPKKVLVLDLDNTLWGGLAGEAEHTPVQLSEDHTGLAYKNLQRVILQMKKQGVLLTIVSKNNEKDAMDLLENHPHMVLRPKDFVGKRINWIVKYENIKQLAKELNLGLQSFVFWDDSPAERELVKEFLPEVTVPDFPKKPEELARSMVAVYKEYFQKPKLTKEDTEKTQQYVSNARRDDLKKAAVTFEDYLKQLDTKITRVNPREHTERLLQLFNKTNQFNLTTVRHTQEDLIQLLEQPQKEIFLYRVEDRFGDNGLVAAVIVDWEEDAVVQEFVMSCRVMGRNIEQAILAQVENEARRRGYKELRAVFIPSEKNKPVEKLYEMSEYQLLDREYRRNWLGETGQTSFLYKLDLSKEPQRSYVALMQEER